jgi:hypothetical protein
MIPDEPPFRSNRTDAESYAAEALDTLRCRMPIPGEHRRGYIRDALAEAFAQGELQGAFRALWVLAIAHRNAQSDETKGGDVGRMTPPVACGHHWRCQHGVRKELQR